MPVRGFTTWITLTMDKTEQRLCWLLLWSAILFVFVVGNYIQTKRRIDDQLHAITNASMVPPSTINVKTN